MKTQRRTLRGIVTSSMLTLALAVGMMPAAGLAYAADQVGEGSAATEEPQEAESPESEETAVEDSASTDESTPNVIPSEVEGSQAGEAGEGEAATESSVTTTAPAATPTYTTSSQNITAADVPLTKDEKAEPVAGTIEYAGIAYTINPDDPNTVSVTGLATEKPKGEVQIQSQVASDNKLYTVSGIEKVRGGFTAKPN